MQSSMRSSLYLAPKCFDINLQNLITDDLLITERFSLIISTIIKTAKDCNLWLSAKKVNIQTHRDPIWFSRDCREARKAVNNALKVFRKFNLPEDRIIFTELKRNFNLVKNTTKNDILMNLIL